MLPEEYSIDEWKNNSAYWIQNGSYVTANQRTTDDAQGNSLSHANPEGTSRFQARLDYARKFGDHNVTAMVLYYMQNKIVGKEVPYRYMGLSGRATTDYRTNTLEIQHRMQRFGELRTRTPFRRIPRRFDRLGRLAGGIHEERALDRPPQTACIVRSGR